MLSAVLAWCVASLAGGPDPAPNLVVIYIDDLNAAWELPGVIAPNMHALADRGVSFSRAYAGHPVCVPSRASLLAGQRTNHTQVLESDELPPSDINGVPYLPARLSDAGYHTAGVGKIFHFDEPAYWDEFHNFSDDPWVEKPTLPHTPEAAFMVIGGPFLNGPTGALGKMADTKRTDKALVLLEEARQRLDATGQPFAVWLGFQATHDPFVYPEKFGSYSTEADVPPLPAEETTVNWKAGVNKAAYSTAWFFDPDWAPTEAEQRVQAMLAYFRCISFVDEEIGRVLEALTSLGLAESTIVVLVSDHGWSFGEHDHLGKTTGFDEDVVAPLLIAVPSLPQTHGQVVSAPVAQVDLYPTLMELLGLAAPARLDGASLVPLLLDAAAPHPPVFYTTDEEWGFNLTRYVVKRDAGTGRIWKLSAWENDDTIPQVNQLYSLSTDPGEYINRYPDPHVAAKVAELRGELASVGLLGPSARNFSVGVAGLRGVPALTWTGAPALGTRGTLVLGNSTGAPTLGLVFVGLSGAFPGPKSIAVQTQLTILLSIPPEGLSVPVVLPAGAMYDELPIGLQALELDAAAPSQLSRSRALSLFLAY